ncbi:unnamed protein product [Ceratitis capitata]|uniref:Carboxylic ester hydrolase n=1 Tax=Ceratitis capitata TaxID=7213 RepID=A0A811UNL1_CERCA|nr:unnamed protein product [Ceratitis capitata]
MFSSFAKVNMEKPILLVSSFLLLLIQFSHQQAPIVETALGNIRGDVLTTRRGRDIYAYRGIHYAKPPTGLRRFAAPVPVEPWNDTLDALADGPICPQGGPTEGLTESEDCLSLNVYTTNVNATEPVIVYIHGGGNIYGNANSEYGASPKYLLDENVVLVGIQFRLGAFGFLSTSTYEASGNYGYLDQVLALKWVQAHIRSFGGDPTRVTILGLSAGGMAVTLHLVSPMSSGLFSGAVVMSGSATHHYDIDNAYWSRKLAHDLGCPRFNTKYLLNCLRQVSWQQIVNVTEGWGTYDLPHMKWNYEIDGKFLLEHPIESIRSNRFHRVPIIAGITYNEFDFSIQAKENNTDLLDDINENFALYAPELLQLNSTDESKARTIRSFYYNTTDIYKYNLVGFGQMTSDAIIGHGVHRLVELARNFTDVYYYRFDYVGEKSEFPDSLGKPQGACHADDIIYILPRTSFSVENNSTDIFMVDRMVNVIATFAANGKPPVIENITWTPSTADELVVLYNNKYPFISNPFYVDRYAMWDELFPLKESAAKALLPTVVLLMLSASRYLVL